MSENFTWYKCVCLFYNYRRFIILVIVTIIGAFMENHMLISKNKVNFDYDVLRKKFPNCNIVMVV